ncbi:MAG: pyridoxamine 5'-phosphate oxidase [Phycisphaerales bacterium]|nr:pyridoxamine 5'-phosphate oxidase [Phycisphaerales bacterium]
MTRSPRDERREYSSGGLNERDLPADPLVLFAEWYDAAVRAGVREPNAMALATADAEGAPSARIVLLKGFGADGLTFFTNYRSRKGRELEQNPRAALVFWWSELERQVRVEGAVARVSAAESDEYFASRPWYSQIGASVSPQSDPIESREILERAVVARVESLAGGAVPRPAEWGGYCLVPTAFEFWQGRENRLHDRIRYRRDGGWIIGRLAP